MNRMMFGLALLGSGLALACDEAGVEREEARFGEPQPDRGVESDEGIEELAALSADDLEIVFAEGVVDKIPHGVGYGRSIVLPGNPGANGFFDQLWYGKTFDGDELEVINRTAAGQLFAAGIEVDSLGGFVGRDLDEIHYHFFYPQTFPEDGEPSIIVDYSAVPNPQVPFASLLVDQVRRVEVDRYDDLYLGRLLIRTPFGPQLTNYFALSFPDSRPLP